MAGDEGAPLERPGPFLNFLSSGMRALLLRSTHPTHSVKALNLENIEENSFRLASVCRVFGNACCVGSAIRSSRRNSGNLVSAACLT